MKHLCVRALGEVCLKSSLRGDTVTPGFKPFPFHRNVFFCGQVGEKYYRISTLHFYNLPEKVSYSLKAEKLLFAL